VPVSWKKVRDAESPFQAMEDRERRFHDPIVATTCFTDAATIARGPHLMASAGFDEYAGLTSVPAN
jgi:hypothetical protein